MSQACSISSRRRYGLARVCRVWEISRSVIYAARTKVAGASGAVTRAARRRGPVGAASDEELITAIRQVLAESPFFGEGYRKAWARLRYGGIRTSKERVRRLMREHGLQAPHRVGRPHGPKAHDGTIVTDKPDVMWGTDLTTVFTLEEGNAAVFVAVDHCTNECVGIHAAKRADRFQALEPIRRGVREHFGAIGRDVACGLTARHDHGSAYMADKFQDELKFLGIKSSPAFVREPEGNGCAERFIRTLKENLLWIRTFRTVEELRLAVLEFKRVYNESWLIERHGHRPPAAVRRELALAA